MRTRGRRSTVSAAAAVVVAVGLGLAGPPAHSGPVGRTPPPGADPDMPGGSAMSARAYFDARNAYYRARLGDVFTGGHGNLRVAALRDRRRAIASTTGVPSAFAAASPGPVTWGPLGPRPLPNGQVGSGVPVPVSGRATAIAVDPGDSADVYVGTAGGGVFRTRDGGSTWAAVFDDAIGSPAIGALAFAPTDRSVLYVGTGEPSGSGDSEAGVGLYRVDGADGATPTVSAVVNPAVTASTGDGHAFTGRSISRILVSPTQAGTIFVGTTYGSIGKGSTEPRGAESETGVFRSTNATADAASVAFTKLTGALYVSDLAFEPASETHLLVAAQDSGANGGGVWRTTDDTVDAPTFTQTHVDGATSWDTARLGASPVGALSPKVYLLEGGGSGSGELLSSTDGVTWSSPLAAGTNICYNQQCWYDDPVAVDPSNPMHVVLGGSFDGSGANVLRNSTNGGVSYSSGALLHPDMHAIAFDPSNPATVWIANDGGIFRSDNGGSTWASKNAGGLDSIQFQSMAVHPTDPEFTIGGTQDNGTDWMTPSGPWTRVDWGDGGYAAIDQNATDTANVTMYHTYFNSTGYQIGYARVTTTSAAHDGNWPFYGCGGSSNGISCGDATLFYAPMTLGPGSPNTVYFGTDRLYRSANGTSMSVVSQSPITSGQKVASIAVAHQDDAVRLVGLTDGHVWGTTDGSSTLTDMTGGWPTTDAAGGPVFVAGLGIDPTDDDVAYVALGDYFGTGDLHVWRTSNLLSGAPTWTAGTGVPDVPVNALTIDRTNPSHVYAGTDVGVYASADGGATWAPYGTGMPAVPVYDVAIVGAGTDAAVLRVATHGRGMWQAPLPDTGNPTSVDVTPANPSVPEGDAADFTAVAHYADGSTLDVTGNATWGSSDTGVADFPSPGSASTHAVGTTTVTATYRGTSGGTTLDVTPAVARSLTVTPAPASVASGLTTQLAATTTMSDSSLADVTTTAAWSSSDPTIATVSSSGLVTGVKPGVVDVTAQSGSVSGSTQVTVKPAVLKTLSVSPTAATVRIGSTKAFTATGHYSDGSTRSLTRSVTWTSSSTAVATIVTGGSSAGVAKGRAYGTTTIRAKLGGVTSSGASLTVHHRRPTITGFSPTHGRVGTTVTITGAHFTTKPMTVVLFGGVKSGHVVVVSGTKLRAVVPKGAKTGRITVKTDGGSATSTTRFRIP